MATQPDKTYPREIWLTPEDANSMAYVRKDIVDGLLDTLRPFAHEAGRWTADTPDSTPMLAGPIREEGWEYRFTLGDLRRAASALSSPAQESGAVVSGAAKLAEKIVGMKPPEDPHTDAWLLGFCRARKMAAELILAAKADPRP